MYGKEFLSSRPAKTFPSPKKYKSFAKRGLLTNGSKPTDGEAIPRMTDGNLQPGLSCRFYPWYCLAIRGYLWSLRLSLFNSWFIAEVRTLDALNALALDFPGITPVSPKDLLSECGFGDAGVVWRNGVKLCGDATWQGRSRPPLRPERSRPLSADAVRGRSFGFPGTTGVIPQKSSRRSRLPAKTLRQRTHFRDAPPKPRPGRCFRSFASSADEAENCISTVVRRGWTFLAFL